MGPPLEFVSKAFEGTAYYHIEIFVSLPGKQEELFKEREMENVYGVETKRPYNMIFVRDQGAAWDIYTLGCYRDIKHWAVGEEVTKEDAGGGRERRASEAPRRSAPTCGRSSISTATRWAWRSNKALLPIPGRPSLVLCSGISSVLPGPPGNQCGRFPPLRGSPLHHGDLRG